MAEQQNLMALEWFAVSGSDGTEIQLLNDFFTVNSNIDLKFSKMFSMWTGIAAFLNNLPIQCNVRAWHCSTPCGNIRRDDYGRGIKDNIKSSLHV